MKPVQFSASRISDLLAGGSGKTRMNYIFELAERSIGIDNSITTPAMIHGQQSEYDAITILIERLGNGSFNMDGKGGQVYFKINDYVGATPDAISDEWVGDAKCQYFIHTFFQQNDKLAKRYYDQVQCQMLALNVKKGYLINYLTKPEMYGPFEWEEYPFELEQRYHIHEIEPDEQVQNDILEYSEKYFPMIGQCAEMLKSAKKLTHEDFFNVQFYDKVRFMKLKEVDWSRNDREVFCFENVFYVQKS